MTRSAFRPISLEGLSKPPRFEVTMRSTQKKTEWFRIQNSDTTSDTTEIYIYDEIGGWFGVTAAEFIEQLTAVDTAKIDLHLNSPGGEVFDAVAIYNALVMHKAEVVVYVDSLAASAASFIAQSGDSVIMKQASTMMIHDASGGCHGTSKEMGEMANILNKVSNNIAGIYTDRAGGTTEEWRAFMREEVWYTAQEAVDAGLADSVLSKKGNEDSDSSDDSNTEDKWDLSTFNFAHAGRDDAPSPDEIRRKVIKNMGKRNVTSQTGPEGTETPAVPPVTPSAPPADPAEDDTEEDGTETEDTVTPPPPAPSPPPTPAPPTTPPGQNTAGHVVVNGVSIPVSNAAVRNHITALERFRTETLEAGRRTFVQNLSATNKIGAPQVEGLEAFALALNDEQYEAWTKTWDVAVGLPLLGNHAGGISNPNGDTGTTESAAADHLSILKDTVRQHKLSKMPKDQIEKTASYNELMKLDPTYTL